MYDCKNTECVVNQLHRISESKAMKDRMHIQELNGAKEMYAGYKCLDNYTDVDLLDDKKYDK